MKITCTDTDGVLDEVTLGDDDAGDFIVDPPPLPGERRSVQITPLFRADRPFVRGRGNRTVTLAWTVARSHEDAADACEFVHRHADTVPVNASITIEAGSGKWTYTGVISAVAAVDHYGIATVFQYRLDGAVVAAAETD